MDHLYIRSQIISNSRYAEGQEILAVAPVRVINTPGRRSGLHPVGRFLSAILMPQTNEQIAMETRKQS